MAGTRKRLEGGEGWSIARPCPACGQYPEACRCAAEAAAAAPAAPSAARIRLETRRGKPTTVVRLTGAGDEARRELARKLRTKCAAGGSVDGDDGIVIQGDHRERVRALLVEEGIRVRSG